MEELKVRAWWEKGKRMLDIAAIDFLEKEVKSHANVMYRFDDIELMQSTGLKDIYDKDVYEGDIITTPFEEDGMFVVYLNTTAGLYIKSLLSGNIQFIDDPGSLEELEELKAEIRQSIEIKGNIYENSELLEGNLNGLL